MIYLQQFLLLILLKTLNGISVARYPKLFRQITIQMNGYKPDIDDDYVATSLKVEPGYIVSFQPVAQADRIHHMLLFGCTTPAKNTQLWKGLATCDANTVTHILYAWARNAPELRLPDDVAFSVGHVSDNIRYLVLQMHYAHPFIGNVLDYSGVVVHMIDTRPKYLAAVYLFVSGSPIMPGFAHYQTNISCIYNGETDLHPFAFRTHAHSYGRVISAFYKNPKKGWTMIGKRNPQWPQLFEPIKANLTISSGDLMAATCVYDSSQLKKVIYMGNTGADEMCNFYMMFYWDANMMNPFSFEAVCPLQQEKEIIDKEYPAEGVSLLPPHPELEEKAHQSSKRFGITEGLKLMEIEGIKFGEITGLSFDPYGNLVVLHRASRKWDENTFDYANNLRYQQAINEDTIFVMKLSSDRKRLLLNAKYGRDQFYLPHAIFVDHNNDFYTSDVGSHQVIKWKLSNGQLKLVYALGEQFVPGSDRNHFCKPTGVVTTPDGNVFIADGYCNSRIVRFNANGEYISEWGQDFDGNFIAHSSFNQFAIPHDITSNEDGSSLYIADRENARIQIYRPNGQFIGSLTNPSNRTLFLNVYSAHYHNGAIYFIPGKSDYQNVEMQIFVGHADSVRVQFAFKPTNYSFNRPHIIRISPDEQFIYIGELGEKNGGRLLQFVYKTAISQSTTKQPTDLYNLRTTVGNNRNVATWANFLIFAILITSVFFSLLFCVFRKKKFIRRMHQQSVLDRAGFRPLRTDDPESSDDDSEEDTIIALRKGVTNRF